MAKWRVARGAARVVESVSPPAGEPPGVDHERLLDRTDDEKFVDLSGEESAALAKWRDRLGGYVEGQGTLDALRLRRPSDPPWPAPDNPMFGYLYERGREIVLTDGTDTALAWLASNAWFEGAIAERSRFARHLNTD
jgi:hypothetical protein